MVDIRAMIEENLTGRKKELIVQLENIRELLRSLNDGIADLDTIAAKAVFVIYTGKRNYIGQRCQVRLFQYEGASLKEAFKKAILSDDNFIDRFMLGEIFVKDVYLKEDSINNIYVSEEIWMDGYIEAADELIRQGKARSKTGLAF